MEVITSHTNADFDTFASMVAAKKLYPDALLVFSGSMEKALRDAFAEITPPHPIDKFKDIDATKITRVIIVDVRQADRLGHFSDIVKDPKVELHIYDHHPDTGDDLHGIVEVTEPYGSTTTVLTHIIIERGLEITPQEATIMMAGIYEDTGSLSYPSTTTKDYEAAAHLLSRGADLTEVADLLRKELSPQEVSLLSEFLNSETTYAIGGVNIVVVEGYLEKNIGDISILAHKIQDIEGTDCLFMLVDSEDRVHVVARSRVEEVDVGLVARDLGGGGHPQAASATLKGLTLIQAKEQLLAAIKKNIVPVRTAEDIMSFPPITVGPATRLRDAVELMRRYNINAAPVVEGEVIVGVVTRQVSDKAVYHGLGDSPVEDYMTTECEWVEHTTSIEEIRDKVIGHGQRLLPVLKAGRVAGVITRTDLLKLLQEELRERPQGTPTKKVRYLAKLMKEALPDWVTDILREAGEVADRLGCKAYAVGGFVRDLVLRRENLDIDIVIEGGDGIEFASVFAARKGFRVRPHERFRTAVVIFPDGFKIDVATARLEYYEKPGALPTIERSSLKLDLYRRDFIINTLALSLNPGRFGELIDFFGAQKDLKEKTIRVLHNLSFVEDPTRALRAVRFSVKFGFKIGTHTLKLIKNAVKLDLFGHISGARLFDEVRHILEEEMAAKSIEMLDELGLLVLVHKGITWDLERERFFERTNDTLMWHRLLYTEEDVEGWMVLLLALTDPLAQEELEALVKKLGIEGKKRVEVIRCRAKGFAALGKVNAGLARRNSELYSLLDPLPLEMILYLMARTENEETKKLMSKYITQLRRTTTFLDGNDLIEMGVPEGPSVGEVLKLIFRMRLDEEVETKVDEERFVKTYMKKKGWTNKAAN